MALNSRQKLAQKLWAQRKELRALRGGVVMAHGLSSDAYIQPPEEMRRRTRVCLAKAINQSVSCKSLLGYYPKNIPET